MPTAPNTSFIPKRGPAKRSHQTASRQVHLFTIFSYIFFSATLVATVGVFFYSGYIEKLRQQEISTLNAAVSSFDEGEMQEILKFDSRLRQAESRLDNSVSTVSIFDALEAATVKTLRLESLVMERDFDNQFVLTAEVQADSFDSTLFQRGVFERNTIIESVEISDLEIVSEAGEEGQTVGDSGVTFIAKIGVPLKAVPYQPAAAVMQELPVVAAEAVSTSSVSEEVVEDNQNSL